MKRETFKRSQLTGFPPAWTLISTFMRNCRDNNFWHSEQQKLFSCVLCLFTWCLEWQGTLWTIERFLSSMNSYMYSYLQIRLIQEGLLYMPRPCSWWNQWNEKYWTIKGFLSSVNSHMLLKLDLLREWLQNFSIIKGFFSNVSSHMYFQDGNPWERFGTFGTTVGFLSSVSIHVSLQMG